MKPLFPKFFSKVKKTFPIICVVVVLGVSFRLVQIFSAKNAFTSVSPYENISIFKQLLQPIYSSAEVVTIPSVGIKVSVVPVGLSTDGSLETPKEWLQAGWYSKGAKPGENGNLIIDGHYDDHYGKPAAFWELKNVKLGDKVVVTDSYGRSFEYKISEYTLIGINDPDRLKVFEDSDSARITLITCGGVWIPGKATYDKRLAVLGELIR